MSSLGRWRLALLAGLAGGLLGAQEVPAGQEPDPLEAILNSRIEGASLRPQSALVSPQAIESVERARIAASGAFRIADVLTFMNNVQVWEGDTAFTRVSIRGGVGGTIPRTVQILVDGVPLFNAVEGAADLDTLPIPLDAVEKIEVVRGPASSLYGANAQQGVILITTRRAKEGWDGSVRAGAGENGTFRSQGFFSVGSGDLDVVGGFGADSVRAWSDPYYTVAGDHAFQPQNQAHGQTFFIRPELRVGSGSLWAEVALGAKTGNPERAEGGAPTYTGLYQLSSQSTTTGTAQVGWKQDWNPALRSELRLYQVHETLGVGGVSTLADSPSSPAIVGLFLALDPAFATAHDPVDYTGRGGALQVNLDPSPGLHFVFGADGCVSTSPESLVLGLVGPQRETSSGIFGSVDWDLGAVALSGGLRDAHDTLGGGTLSPRLALIVPLGDGSVLRGGWFTSTRSPQFFEKRAAYDSPLFPSVQAANPDLGPEKAVNYELGWRKTFGQLVTSFTLFRTSYRQLITIQLVPATPRAVSRYVNQPDGGTNTGLELALRGELLPGWTFGLTGALMDFPNPLTGSQTYFVPKVQSVAWSRWQRGPWELYGAAKYFGTYTRWGTDNGLVTDQARPAVLLDFNLAFVPVKGMRLSAYGVNAASRATPMADDGTVNATLVRYARRELGLQFGLRF